MVTYSESYKRWLASGSYAARQELERSSAAREAYRQATGKEYRSGGSGGGGTGGSSTTKKVGNESENLADHMSTQKQAQEKKEAPSAADEFLRKPWQKQAIEQAQKPATEKQLPTPEEVFRAASEANKKNLEKAGLPSYVSRESISKMREALSRTPNAPRVELKGGKKLQVPPGQEVKPPEPPSEREVRVAKSLFGISTALATGYAGGAGLGALAATGARGALAARAIGAGATAVSGYTTVKESAEAIKKGDYTRAAAITGMFLAGGAASIKGFKSGYIWGEERGIKTISDAVAVTGRRYTPAESVFVGKGERMAIEVQLRGTRGGRYAELTLESGKILREDKATGAWMYREEPFLKARQVHEDLKVMEQAIAQGGARSRSYGFGAGAARRAPKTRSIVEEIVREPTKPKAREEPLTIFQPRSIRGGIAPLFITTGAQRRGVFSPVFPLTAQSPRGMHRTIERIFEVQRGKERERTISETARIQKDILGGKPDTSVFESARQATRIALTSIFPGAGTGKPGKQGGAGRGIFSPVKIFGSPTKGQGIFGMKRGKRKITSLVRIRALNPWSTKHKGKKKAKSIFGF